MKVNEMPLKFLTNNKGIYLLNKSSTDIIKPVSIDKIISFPKIWQSSLEPFMPFDKLCDKVELNSVNNVLESGFPLIICSECSSTLDVMRYLCEKEVLDNWSSLIAFEQINGRGQLGRKWHSPQGNLFATVILPELSDEISRVVPFIAGIGLAEYLEKLGLSVGIKWPNDIIINSRKTGGILVENREGHIWLGVGVNLVSAPSDDLMRINGAFKAASLKDFKVEINIIDFWFNFVKNVYRIIEQLQKPKSLSAFIGEVEKRLLFLGETVKIRQPGSEESYYALLLGLAEDGALKIDRAGKILELYSAEILPA